MGDLLERITAAQNIKVKTTKQTKPNSVLLYIVSFLYLLIPVLSTESFVCWSIGIIGIYKTAKLYKNNEEKKELKALKYFLVSIAIAVMFNALVYYITKILMKIFG